jgi:anti-sigma B factor antagonist
MAGPAPAAGYGGHGDVTGGVGVTERGATAVIADLTRIRFCDSAGLRHLLLAHRQAARAGVQLRLAIPRTGRITELTGINRFVAVYSTLQLAVGAGPPG